MYWIEEIERKRNVTELSDDQVLENIAYAKIRVGSLYRRELHRLEKLKSKVIIKSLDQFRVVQEKYYEVKSKSPAKWLDSWEVYNSLIKEAQKRKLDFEDATSFVYRNAQYADRAKAI